MSCERGPSLFIVTTRTRIWLGVMDVRLSNSESPHPRCSLIPLVHDDSFVLRIWKIWHPVARRQDVGLEVVIAGTKQAAAFKVVFSGTRSITQTLWGTGMSSSSPSDSAVAHP